MSLLRLLTSGRCLMGLKDSANRYRVNEQALLPKFGSARNPFRKTVVPAKAVAPGVPQVATPAEALVCESPKEAKPGRSQPKGLACRVTNRLTRLIKGRSATAVLPATGAKPMQAELALESVQVMRNDLSDSDIEVVPARKPVPATGPVAAGPRAGFKPVVGWARKSISLFRKTEASRTVAKP